MTLSPFRRLCRGGKLCARLIQMSVRVVPQAAGEKEDLGTSAAR
jgi:hypothetical protein